MYAKSIDTARKVVALSFAVCGLGFAAVANVQQVAAMAVLGLGALLSLVAAFGLFVEYLVRARFESQRGRTSAFQFTLGEIMVWMVVVASVLGVFRVFGWSTMGLIILVVLFLACCLESLRLRPK